MRFGNAHRDHHAFAGGEAIGLDDDRYAVFFDVSMRLCGVAEGCVRGSRYTVAHHETLGKIFRAFKLRRALRGTKYAQPGGAKCIHYAIGERRFGADYR